MSATSEHLLVQIKELEDAIIAVAESGHDTKEMRNELKKLHEQFARANSALNEGKQVLKG